MKWKRKTKQKRLPKPEPNKDNRHAKMYTMWGAGMRLQPHTKNCLQLMNPVRRCLSLGFYCCKEIQ